MKEKILKNIEEFIFNKSFDLEKIDEELEELVKKIDDLYYKIDSNMSTYKTELYLYKYYLLETKFNKFVTSYYKRIKRAHSKSIIYSIIKNYIILFFTYLLSGNPLSLFFSMLGLYISFETLSYCIDSLKITFNKSEKVEKDKETLSRLAITMNNSINSIGNNFKRIMENLENTMKVSSDNLDDIIYANNIILNYIYNNELIMNEALISDDVKNLVVKVLQDDLKTEEKDMKKLLDMAYKNVNEVKQLYNDVEKEEKTLKKTKKDK